MPYEITQCYLPPGRGDFTPLPQPKLVLDLATQGVAITSVGFDLLISHTAIHRVRKKGAT